MEKAEEIKLATDMPGQLVPITSPVYFKSYKQKIPLENPYLYLYSQLEIDFIEFFQIDTSVDWFYEWLGIDYPLNKLSSSNQFQPLIIPKLDYEALKNSFNSTVISLFENKQLLLLLWEHSKEYKYQEQIRQVVINQLRSNIPNLFRLPLTDSNTLINCLNGFLVKQTTCKIDELFTKQKPTFFLKAKTKNIEEQLISFLASEKTTLCANDLNIPQYSSWAEINPGVKLILKTEEYQLEYTPHTTNILPLNHKIKCQEEIDAESVFKNKMVNVVSFQISNDSKRIFDQLLDHHILFQTEYEYIYAIKTEYKNGQGNKDDLFAILFEDAMTSQERYYLKQLINNFDFQQQKHHYYVDESIYSVTVDKAKRTNDWYFQQSVYKKHSSHFSRNIIACLKNICQTLFLQHNTLEEIKNDIKGRQQILYTLLSQSFKSQCSDNLTTSQQEAIHNFFQEVSFYWSFNKQNFSIHEEERTVLFNNTPLSETGKIKITFQNPDSLEHILVSLANIGIISSYDKPLQTVGYHHDICINSKRLKVSIPKYHTIIHGLTGAHNSHQVFKRVQQMVLQGGILSQMERRRLGLEVYSMSPLGDIASGLDWAVPATINTYPSYGNHVFFIMKPDIIYRKQIFFSPTDFGGGKNRFQNYNNYAQKLGQKSFFEPIEFTHKNHHLSSVENLPLNEVWFNHSISWQEISYIIVTTKNNLEHKIKKLLQEYSHTSDIQILSYTPKAEARDKNKPDISPQLKSHIKNISKNSL